MKNQKKCLKINLNKILIKTMILKIKMIKYLPHKIVLIIKMTKLPRNFMEIVGDYKKFNKIKVQMISFIVKDVKDN